jgi:hypothetical protein
MREFENVKCAHEYNLKMQSECDIHHFQIPILQHQIKTDEMSHKYFTYLAE